MSTSASRQTKNPVPQSVARIADLMSAYRPTWCLCGGWAVDAELGRETRDHRNVDIAVFLDDQRALLDHLAGWDLIAHDANADTNEPWNGRPLDLPAHIHSRLHDPRNRTPDRLEVLTTEQGFGLDIQFNERSGDDWVLSREPGVTVPLRRAVRQSEWDLPTLAPEVVLFYKASGFRRRDKLDFLALLPHLTAEQRDWLRNAISLVGHPWLAQLS